jgi:hypothetical protein
MELTLQRFVQNEERTLGILYDHFKGVPLAVTLELPWRNNEKCVSCIPSGSYTISLHDPPKHGQCLSVHSVPGRTNILIHKGNTLEDTEGCILLGKLFDLEAEDNPQVHRSKAALEELLIYLSEHDTNHRLKIMGRYLP